MFGRRCFGPSIGEAIPGLACQNLATQVKHYPTFITAAITTATHCCLHYHFATSPNCCFGAEAFAITIVFAV